MIKENKRSGNDNQKWGCVCCKQDFYGTNARYKQVIGILGLCWFCVKAGCSEACELGMLRRKYQEFDAEEKLAAALLGSIYERNDF